MTDKLPDPLVAIRIANYFSNRELRRVKILYTNHRGEIRLRNIMPSRVYYGECEWHKGAQWLLVAGDYDRFQNGEEDLTRTFAVCDIQSWEVQ